MTGGDVTATVARRRSGYSRTAADCLPGQIKNVLNSKFLSFNLRRKLMMKRRNLLLVLSVDAALVAPVQAQQFFRIGTGGTAGTYYPVGGMIANAVSQPGKIVATAQATNGSVANVNGVAGGAMESGFSQSDVATWPTVVPACLKASPRWQTCA